MEEPMKQIAALLLATASLLTLNAGAQASERWGWAALETMKAWPTRTDVPLAQLYTYVVNGDVSVVPLDVDPVALKAPGVLAAALPQLQEAVEAIQTLVANDPALVTNLKARGLRPDDVVGLANTPQGITLFVSTEA
jgi:hypothetical protein